MQGAAGVTMMAWVSVNADFVCPNTRAVMGKGWDYSAGLWCQDAAVPAPGLAGEVRVSGAQSWGYPGESTIERNKWMLLAVTWDHQQVRHYVNGVPVRPFTDPGAFDDHDPTFAIGCMVTQWFTPGQRIYPFIGTIDEATLYRRPLSDAEIATYYAAADPCVYSALPIADDFNSCTEDSCDPSVGPVHAPTNEGTSCDDGNTCTTADKCHVGVCQPGPATACAGTGHYYAPLVDLGAFGTEERGTQAYGINNNGEVVGTAFFPDDGSGGGGRVRAFRYTDAGGMVRVQPEVLGCPGCSMYWGLAINSSGVVTGQRWGGGGAYTQAPGGPVIDYTYNIVNPDGTLLGPSVPNAINDSGTLAGYQAFPSGGGPSQAFRYNPNGVFQLLGTLPGPQFSGSTTAFGIDPAGRVVGVAHFVTAWAGRAFLFTDAGGMTELVASGGPFAALNIATAVTTNYIVGMGTLPGGLNRGFRLHGDGSIDKIELPGSVPADQYWTSAAALNSRGDVVGFLGMGWQHATIYTNEGQFHDLNDFVDPSSGWTLQSASGINDNLEVVGYGTHGTGPNPPVRAFKMKLPNLAPCPASTSVCQQGTGTRNPVTGLCSYSGAPDGTACDDGNASTRVDTCHSGTCWGSVADYAGTPSYASLKDLGVLDGGDDVSANGINAAGDVVVTEGASTHNTVWRYGATTHTPDLIPTLPSDSGFVSWYATGIDAQGTVVGLTGLNGEGFAATTGHAAQIFTPRKGYGAANAINAGRIAASEPIYGANNVYAGYASAYRRDTDGTKHFVGQLQGTTSAGGTLTGWTEALGIGPSGELVGYAGLAEPSRAFTSGFVFAPSWGMREAYRFTDPYTGVTNRQNLNDYAAANGWQLLYMATATNGAQTVGWGVKGDRCHAFRYSTGSNQVIDLGVLDATHPGADSCGAGQAGSFSYYSPSGINAGGEIVGNIAHGGAFYYSDAVGGMMDLQELVDPALHATLVTATGINDNHEVVGTMTFGTNPKGHAYKMTLPAVATEFANIDALALRFEGIANFTATDRVAIFSYTNSGNQNFRVSYGATSPPNTLFINGSFVPSNVPPVPEWFLAGDHPAALVVPWLPSTTTMIWTVGSQTATATDSGAPLSVGPTPDGNGYGPTLPSGAVNLRPTFAAAISASVVATDFTLDAQQNKVAAGELPGKFDVTSDGAATYVIPIEVPPGRNGMQPRLALQYNSRGGDGPFGVGWSLAGPSQIMRCKKTLAQDGRGAQVQFDSTDAFCLDGKRLVSVTPPLDSSTLEFRTEEETYAKITVPLSTIDASGPRTFEVRTADGLIHTYQYDQALDAGRVHPWDDPVNHSTDFSGITNQHVGDGTAARLFWNISSTKDRFGNTITYNYQTFPASSEFGGVEDLLTSIVYLDYQGTARTKLSVEFQHKDRPDPTFAYVAGARYNRTQIYTSIDVKYNDTKVRSYPLTYFDQPSVPTVSGRSLLYAVGLCAADGACVRPTTFAMMISDENTDSITDDVIDLPSNIDALAAGDFNGDGRDDLVYHAGGGWKVVLAALDPQGVSGYGPATALALVAPSLPNIDMKAVQVGDIDMDGLADLIILNIEGPPSGPGTGYWHYFRSRGDGTFEELSMGPSTPASLNRRLVLSDLTGDGLPEVIAFDFSGLPNLGYLLNSNGVLTAGASSLGSGWNRGPAWGLDPTGAGIGHVFAPDVVVSDTLLTHVRITDISVDGAGTPHQELTNLRGVLKSGGALVPVDTYFADVNGDGLPDAVAGIMNSSTNRETPALLLNSGMGFMLTDLNPLGPASTDPSLLLLPAYPRTASVENIPRDYPCGGSTGTPCANVKVVDWNQDGRQDILVLDNGRSDSTPFGARASGVVYLSTGTGFTPTTVDIPVPSDATLSIALDPYGAGLTQILQKQADGKFHLYSNGQVPNLLERINTGVGFERQIQYGQMASWRGAYTRGTSCSAPTYCVSRGPWIVESVQTLSDAQYGGRTSNYQYLDARSDLHGLGWLGVAQNIVSEVETGTLSGTSYWGNGGPARLAGRYPLAGKPIAKYSSVPYAPAGNPTSRNLVSWTTFGYDALDIGGSRFVARLHSMNDVRAETTDAPPFGPALNLLLLAHALAEGTPPLQGVPRLRDVTDGFSYDSVSGALTGHEMTSVDGYHSVDAITPEPEDSTNWLVHLPHRIQTTDTSPLGRHQVRTREIFHDLYGSSTRLTTVLPTGAVTDVVLEPDGAQNPQSQVYLKTHFDRTADFGVVRRITETDAPQTQRTTTIQLTEDQVYPLEITNPEGHHFREAFHPGYGVQILSVDPNQFTSSRQIDGFGRTKRETTSGGYRESWQYLLPQYSGMKVSDAVDGGQSKTFVLDQFGRVIESDELTASGQTATSRVDYETSGINQIILHRPSGTGTVGDPKTLVQLDNLGRPVSITRAGNTVAETRVYQGNKVTTTSETGVKKIQLSDGFERVIETRGVNDSGAEVPTTYRFSVSGRLENVTMPGTASLGGRTILYDVRDRQVLSTDPDSGLSIVGYNGFGDVVSRLKGNLDVETIAVDRLGRQTLVENKNASNRIEWDTSPSGVGSMANWTARPKDDSFSASSAAYSYDDVGGRVNGIASTIGPHSYDIGRTFDGFGRLDLLEYPSFNANGLTLKHTYNSFTGLLETVFDSSAPADPTRRFWKAIDRDLEGRILNSVLGNGIAESRTYDALGRIWTIRATAGAGASTATIDFFAYLRNDAGDVRSRTDSVLGTIETFDYDALERLHTWNYAGVAGTGNWQVSYPYDDAGNLLGRTVVSGAGPGLTFHYGEAGHGGGPHAISSANFGSYQYDLAGQQTSAPGRALVAYHMNGLPSLIRRDNGSEVRYSFDPFGHRVRKAETSGATTTYVDQYYEHRENLGSSQEVFNIFADGRKVAEIVGADGAASPIRYLHGDGLGSVVVSTDQNAVPDTDRRAYDPFGRRFDYHTSPLVDAGAMPSTLSGFTGENEDPDVGLVNLNARLYDSRVGRFVSPDVLVGRPLDGQSFNPYSYAYNNPLTFTDRSGLCPPEGSCPPPPPPIIPIQGDLKGWEKAWREVKNVFTLAPGTSSQVYQRPAPQSPWTTARPADFQGTGTGDAPALPKGTGITDQGSPGTGGGVTQGGNAARMFGPDMSWDRDATQHAINRALLFRDFGPGLEELELAEGQRAIDLASSGLSSRTRIYDPRLSDIANTKYGVSRFGPQTLESAAMARSNNRHEDRHDWQQQHGSKGQGAWNEIDALETELDFARDSGLNESEILNIEGKLGAQIRSIYNPLVKDGKFVGERR
jgi:RHS repeat-associated protein